MNISYMCRVVPVLLAMALAACSVQFVSPYNAQIANGLVQLQTELLATATDISRNAQSPATRAKAAYENYAKTYDTWLAQIETMRTISAMGNPQFIDCASAVKRIGAVMPSLASSEVSELGEADATKVDCQTLLLGNLKERIESIAANQKEFCAATNKNIVNDCAGGFGARVGVIHVNGANEAPIIQPALRTIRTLMRVQEVKKPASGT